MTHHHGTDGECHPGPGGIFGCDDCDRDRARAEQKRLAALDWQPASPGNPLELADLPGGGKAMRNASDPDVALEFTPREWECFLDGARAGEFDDLTR